MLLKPKSLSKLLSNGLGNSLVYGPEEPMISKIRDQFLTNVTIKIDEIQTRLFAVLVIGRHLDRADCSLPGDRQ